VTPDRVKTVLRSRLGQDYGNCRPASGPREAAGCRNRLLTGYSGPELDVASETLFLSRRLSFRRLLWVDWRRKAVSQLLWSDNDSRGVVPARPTARSTACSTAGSTAGRDRPGQAGQAGQAGKLLWQSGLAMPLSEARRSCCAASLILRSPTPAKEPAEDTRFFLAGQAILASISGAVHQRPSGFGNVCGAIQVHAGASRRMHSCG
jgi:hypothetical protein